MTGPRMVPPPFRSIGKLTFESGYPSQETVDKLYDEKDFQRLASPRGSALS